MPSYPIHIPNPIIIHSCLHLCNIGSSGPLGEVASGSSNASADSAGACLDFQGLGKTASTEDAADSSVGNGLLVVAAAAVVSACAAEGVGSGLDARNLSGC